MNDRGKMGVEEKTEKKELFGIKFNPLTKERAVELVKDFINDKGKSQISFVPVYSIVVAQKDEEFKVALNSSSFVLADGMPIVWVSKLFGMPIPERIAGCDFFMKFCRVASEKQYTFFLMGATEEVLSNMCANLKKEFSSLRIVGTYSPPFKKEFSEEDNLIMINKINEAKPDILWVGMSAPKQEKWIFQNLEKLDIKVAAGVGAVFDFIAGTKRRAPKWIQNIGMEWFWRLVHEPKRLWKRYLIGNSLFLWLVLKEFIKIKLLKRKHV